MSCAADGRHKEDEGRFRADADGHGDDGRNGHQSYFRVASALFISLSAFAMGIYHHKSIEATTIFQDGIAF